MGTSTLFSNKKVNTKIINKCFGWKVYLYFLSWLLLLYLWPIPVGPHIPVYLRSWVIKELNWNQNGNWSMLIYHFWIKVSGANYMWHAFFCGFSLRPTEPGKGEHFKMELVQTVKDEARNKTCSKEACNRSAPYSAERHVTKCYLTNRVEYM